jgi:hypothetical protein
VPIFGFAGQFLILVHPSGPFVMLAPNPAHMCAILSESSHRFADWKWVYISLLIIEKWQIRGSCVLTQDFFGQMF